MWASQYLPSGNKNFGWSKDVKYNMSNKNLLQQGGRQKILIVKRNNENTKTEDYKKSGQRGKTTECNT